MNWRKAISMFDVAIFGAVLPAVLATAALYLLSDHPLAALAPFTWGALCVFNWLEFRRWKLGTHRLLEESARDRDEFSRQVFLAKATGASRLAALLNQAGVLNDPLVRQAIQSLYESVARHPLPEDAEPHLREMQRAAAQVARGGMPKELLH